MQSLSKFSIASRKVEKECRFGLSRALAPFSFQLSVVDTITFNVNRLSFLKHAFIYQLRVTDED